MVAGAGRDPSGLTDRTSPLPSGRKYAFSAGLALRTWSSQPKGLQVAACPGTNLGMNGKPYPKAKDTLGRPGHHRQKTPQLRGVICFSGLFRTSSDDSKLANGAERRPERSCKTLMCNDARNRPVIFIHKFIHKLQCLASPALDPVSFKCRSGSPLLRF